MRVGIAPASTQTSAATIRWLLRNASDKGTEVYAVYRDLAKVPAEFKAHASFTAVQGDVEDADSLDFTGCDSVLTSTPPCFDGSDPIKKAELMAQNVKFAVERAGVKRLMLLSSVGAEFSEGVGEILTNHAAERVLRTAQAPEILFVRCAYFMENWVAFSQGTLKKPEPYFDSLITPLDWKIPMVAVDDIGSTLATGLTSGYTPPKKPYIFALHGPKDYSPLDVQAAFTAAMGKSVDMRPVEKDKIREFYKPVFPPQIIDLWVEMAMSFLPGGIAEPGAPGIEKVDVVRGKTSLDDALKAAVDGGMPQSFFCLPGRYRFIQTKTMRRQLMPSRCPQLSVTRQARHAFSTSTTLRQDSSTNSSVASNSRWLGDLRKRMHQCLSKDSLPPKHAAELKERMSYLDKNWLELSAGREGYLADVKWRGLDRHSIAWGDMDSMVRHVNNVIYNRYAESGRVGWVMNLANNSDPQYREQIAELMTPRDVGLILASIKTDFKFPMTFPDHVTVMHKLITKPDNSSDRMLFEAVAFSHRHQRPAAKFIEDVVVYDYKAGKKAPLKPFMVELMAELFAMQNQRKEAAEVEIAALHQFVDSLEG